MCSLFVYVIFISVNTHIRLVNGTAPFQGRIEVQHNTAWGTIQSLSAYGGHTVCKMLNYNMRLVHYVMHASWPTHINRMYVCVLGIPKGKFSKQMKKKLSSRIIRIKRIFSGNSEKNAFNPIIIQLK